MSLDSGTRTAAAPPLSPPSVEVALLDPNGVIVAVNDAWNAFCLENGGQSERCGVGVSYLEVCAAAPNDPGATEVAAAVRTAIAGDLPAPLRVVLPCHPPDSTAWFEILISSRLDDDGGVLGATVTLTAVEEPLDVAQPARAAARIAPTGEESSVASVMRLLATLAQEPEPPVALPEIVYTMRQLVPGHRCGLVVTALDGRTSQLYEATPDDVVARALEAEPEQSVVDLLEASTGIAAAGLSLVPVELRAKTLGMLYVGPGTGLSAEQEQLLVSLAAAAALVVAQGHSAQQPSARGSAEDRISSVTAEVVSELQVVSLALRSLLQHVSRFDERQRRPYVEALHSTIARIQNSIARLEATPATSASLKQRVLDLLDSQTAGLAVRGSVDFTGPLDALAPAVADDVVAVVDEGLRNATRHAAPSVIEVFVSLTEEVLLVRVVDDGAGEVSPSRGSGLFTLRRRAASLGGSLEALPREAGGTELTWTIPGDVARRRAR